MGLLLLLFLLHRSLHHSAAMQKVSLKELSSDILACSLLEAREARETVGKRRDDGIMKTNTLTVKVNTTPDPTHGNSMEIVFSLERNAEGSPFSTILKRC